MARYEAEAERRKTLGLSWADIDEAESRTPGRGAHMHEKLSSPSRKRLIYYNINNDSFKTFHFIVKCIRSRMVRTYG